MGRGSRTNSLVGVVGILGWGSIGTDYSSVEFLKPAPALTAELAYSLTEEGRCGARGGLSLFITMFITILIHSGAGHF